jgi:hypothetical protein
MWHPSGRPPRSRRLLCHFDFLIVFIFYTLYLCTSVVPDCLCLAPTHTDVDGERREAGCEKRSSRGPWHCRACHTRQKSFVYKGPYGVSTVRLHVRAAQCAQRCRVRCSMMIHTTHVRTLPVTSCLLITTPRKEWSREEQHTFTCAYTCDVAFENERGAQQVRRGLSSSALQTMCGDSNRRMSTRPLRKAAKDSVSSSAWKPVRHSAGTATTTTLQGGPRGGASPIDLLVSHAMRR